jgi:acetylornithine deacetylase
VGLISGGIAPNVIPPHAEAEVMFRTVGPAAALMPVVERLRDLAAPSVVLEVPAVKLKTLADVETAVFPFTTDIPFLSSWGTPLLFGPGSVLVAHTDHEHVRIDELAAAVDRYVEFALALREG